jgi:hypothetical protein
MPALPRLRSTPRVRTVAALVVGLASISAVVSVRSAEAYVPSQDLSAAINSVLQGNSNLAIQSQFYDGPDGIPGPDGTPDGRGAFWFLGAGTTRHPLAIYAHRVSATEAAMANRIAGAWLTANTVTAKTVDGAVFASWGAAGWENGYGYPVTGSYGVGQREIRWGCTSGETAQWFARITPSQEKVFLMCRSSTRAPHWIAAQG